MLPDATLCDFTSEWQECPSSVSDTWEDLDAGFKAPDRELETEQGQHKHLEVESVFPVKRAFHVPR